jgi:hypothetical protein
MARAPRPAEGERAAIGGYYPQYLVSADLILRRLDEGRLEWVRLADPEAGRLDDFQIGTPNRVDAYQFKWSTHAGTFTYSDLVREAREEGVVRPSLIAQLSDGWKRLRAVHRDRRVVVHLTTNDIPSPNTVTLPVGDPEPERRTFAVFLADGWGPARRGENVGVWLPALEELRRLTGLTAEQFAAFSRDCELEFATSLPCQSSETRQAALRWQQLQALLGFLQQSVQRRVVELSTDQLLGSLGWVSHYASRFRHEFPDPATPYMPISASVSQFDGRLASLRGGYLAVVGPPGSGKSTLLTKALRRPRPERVIRYYAYVPDAQNPAASRGESENFLHDVCLALHHAGITTDDSHLAPELNLLLDRLHRQLALLGDDYRKTGRKTVILIDGLDHIDRELRPSRSLLTDLPRPDQVPDGVFFVLGSQTDRLTGVSERIRHALDADGRRIAIERLDRGSVHEIVRRSGLPVQLSSGQMDRVFDLSDGHPLALGYLVQALLDATDEGQVEAVLSDAAYGGDIEAQYRTYWQAAGSEPALARLLGTVARLRGGADLEQLGRWYGSEAVGKLATFRRYFVEEPGRRWRFFHNSFRVFLARETARDEWSGQASEARDREAHLDLANRFACEPDGSPLRWEEMYHRIRAGDHEGVCRLADQRRLRAQVFSLRPLDAVRTDVELALPSAAARDDVRAFAALTLFRAEVEQRAHLLEEFDLPGLLLDLGEVRHAAESARDGNRPRVDTACAMRLAVRLADVGEVAEARRLFEVAEPLDLLAGQTRQGKLDVWTPLSAWAKAAPRFRPLSDVLEAIFAAPLRELNPWRNDETFEGQLRCRLLVRAGRTLIAQSRWADLELLLVRIPPEGEPSHAAQFWLLLEAAQACEGDNVRSRQFLDRLTGRLFGKALDADQRVRLAEAVLSLTGDPDAARTLVEGLPLLVPDLDRAEARKNADALLGPLLQHARLLYRLGDRRAPGEMVPTGADRAGRDLFLRDVVVVAKIWARNDEALTAWAVRNEVAGIMTRFERSFKAGSDYVSWMVCQGARAWLYRLLVRAVAGHGREALTSLREVFDERWEGDMLRHWPPALRREIALAFADAADEHRAWALEQMQRVASDPEGNIYEFLRESQEQARGWVALGKTGEARALLARVVRRANGIVGEDDQFGRWLTWLDRLADTDPQRAAGLLDWLAASVRVLRETGDGVASGGAYGLVRSAARLDPGRASAVGRWLLDHGVIDYADRVKSLLEGLMGLPGLPWRLVTLALGELVVPFDMTADASLAESAVAEAHREGDRLAATWAADYLARRVGVFAFPSSREGWQRGICSAAERLGFPAPVASPAARPVDRADDQFPGSPDDCLALDGADDLSLDDVLRLGEVAALADVARKESLGSRFDWRPVLVRLLDRRPPEDLGPLVRALRFKRKAALDVILEAGKRRLEAADLDGAYRLATLALEATDRYCWSRRYGDGSRLDATRAIIAARPIEGRRQLWHLLVTDGGRDPTALEEIVTQLRDTLPVAEVWPEVEDHLRALFDEHAAAVDITPPDTMGDTSQAGPVLAQLLLENIDHPVAPVSRAARRATAHGLLAGDLDLSTAFRRLLSPSERRCRAALETLDAASRRGASLPTSMVAELSALASSSDADVVFLTCGLLGTQPQSPVGLKRSKVPSGILLPEDALRGLDQPDFPEPGQPWPDTDDPRQLLAIVRWAFDILSKATGRQEIDLLQRGARLMGELVPIEEWNAAGERRLYRRLDDARLGFTYRRPRSDAALRATYRLIDELWRRGEIETWLAARLVADLRLCDPALALVEPAQRPAEVPTIETGIWGDDQREAWLDAANDALASMPEVVGDRAVLAESSEFVAVGVHGRRWEQRVSVLCAWGDARLPQEELIPDTGRCRVAVYAASTTARPGCPVIGHPNGSSDETPAGEWVAFDPALALSLGWSLTPDGMFRWHDPGGAMMVETVWWQDGPAGMGGRLPEDCIGEGWLVLATPIAWAALSERLEGAVRVRSVTRTTTLERGAKRTATARVTARAPSRPDGS